MIKPVIFLLVSYGLVMWGGSSFVRIILRRMGKTKQKEAETESLPVSEETIEENGIRGGGKYIGYLERFLIFNAFYLRQQTGMVLIFLVVFLLLSKLIILWNYQRGDKGRLSERYLIGTLSSFIFALVCAFLLSLFFAPAAHGH